MCMTTPSVSGITCVVQWRDSAADEIPKVFGPNVDQSKATARVFFFLLIRLSEAESEALSHAIYIL